MHEQIDHTEPEPFDAVVVGAGLAGLTAANRAIDHGLRVLVLDGHPVGGRARTTDRNGWLLNTGPHALYNDGPLDRQLQAWGLHLRGGDPTSYPSSGWRDGALHELPGGAASLARTPLLSWRSKARFGRLFAQIRAGKSAPLVGRSVAEWLADEPTDVTELVETLVRLTTFVHAPDRLDAGAALDQLHHGLGSGVRYLDGGWNEIVAALHRRLLAAGVRWRDEEVVGIARSGEDHEITTTVGRHLARTVIVAAGGPEVERRLTGAVVPEAGDPVQAACLDLLLDRPAPRRGAFGVGVPLYMTPHSAVARLAPDGAGTMNGLQYLRPGTAPEEAATGPDELRAMADALGVDRRSIVGERVLHRVTVAHGMPLAAQGGLLGRPGVATADPAVFRAGDWVGPTGFIADAAAASGIAAGLAAAARCARIAV